MPTTNQKLDRMWSMKRAAPTSETEALMMSAPGEDLTAALDEHPMRDVLASVLEEFTPDERELITLSVVGDMSVREIAAAMGLPKNQVHRRLVKLMPRLADAFKSNPEIMEYVNGDADQGTS